jgi:CheY-like chemotaxis protein
LQQTVWNLLSNAIKFTPKGGRVAMPDEDGYAVFRKIRALPPEEGGDIPAIALTAYGRAEYRAQALEASFYAYAVKPVKPDELVGIIQGVVKR